jgi:hypothetical protein
MFSGARPVHLAGWGARSGQPYMTVNMAVDGRNLTVLYGRLPYRYGLRNTEPEYPSLMVTVNIPIAQAPLRARVYVEFAPNSRGQYGEDQP